MNQNSLIEFSNDIDECAIEVGKALTLCRFILQLFEPDHIREKDHIIFEFSINLEIYSVIVESIVDLLIAQKDQLENIGEGVKDKYDSLKKLGVMV